MTPSSPVSGRRRRAIGVTLTAAALALPASAGATQLFYGTTPANRVVSFTAQAPGRILHQEPIAGLREGETIVGMDQRPSTGQLYALTSGGRLLVVLPATGDTMQVGTEALPLRGTSFGFDFNPVADLIRIVSDEELDLRVNPETGAITGTDGALTYVAGDGGAGTNPSIGAAGYTFSAFGQPAPTATTLLDIDSARDVLVRQDPPNSGALVTIGPLGVDAQEPVHLDITSSQVPYAAIAPVAGDGTYLYRIDPATGRASLASERARIGAPALTALTATGDTPPDTRGPGVAIGNYTIYRRVWLDRGLNFTLSCPEDCTSVVTLRMGGTVLGTQTVQLDEPGTRVASIALTPAGRTAASATGRRPATLTFRTTDLAGNTRAQVTNFISAP